MKIKYTLYSLQKRIITLIVAISFIFCALILKLGVVQIVNGAWLQAKASEQWTRDLPLVAERGKIFDVTGSALAVSYTTYNVYTRARQIKNPVEVSKFLAECLSMLYNDVFEKVTNTSVSEVLIAQQVEKQIAQKIIEKSYSGVYLAENIKRYYPYGNLLTQVLGFTTVDNIGQAGIELFYDNYLKGVNGYSLVQSDIRGVEIENTLKTFVPAIPGMDIYLTIDSKIQLEVERILEKLMVEQKAKSATAIVMKANTGEILAMSTKPSFDLNNIPRDNVSYLMETVKNKSVVDVYEPGSTFKVLTMASILELKKAELTTGFYCGGSIIVDGERIRCWKSSGHGSQNLVDILCNSCNCGFVELGLRLGLKDFYDSLEVYGFGKKTEIEIMGESGGIIMDKSSVKNVDLARMAFGQAVAVTPIQLISAISAVVNGGTYYKPRIISKIVNPDKTIFMESSPTPIKTVVRPDVSQTINMMLEETVSKPGKYTFIPGYEMGGKTGTTQKYENGKISGKYISSFIGTFPASNPEYVILVSVDEPGTGQYYGSVVASPYAKEMFKAIFEYKNIKPTHLKEAMAVLSQEFEMPNLVGLSITQAMERLIKLGMLDFEIAGDGDFVISQYVPAGTIVNKATQVVLMTEYFN